MEKKQMLLTKIKSSAIFVVPTFVLTLLSSCATTDQETGERKKSKAAVYGITGAVAGAAAGAMASSKKDRKKGALIGAVLGGAAGAAYGNYVDQQEAELREAMAGTGVEIDRKGDVLQLTMPGGITFATNSANIANNFYGPLNNLADSFAAYDQSTIDIVGHTDNTGSRQLNMDLSHKRAQSVANYFTARNISATRITFRGVGPDQPIDTNATAQGKANNRRVEITLYPQQ